jgi:hypothetical protein
MVVLPDPERPVNQITHPRSRLACFNSFLLLFVGSHRL